MDSRERTFLALDFQEPDRVPIDFWVSSGMKKKLNISTPVLLKKFLDLHDVDLRYIEGPLYTGPALRTFSDGTQEDIWGVRRHSVTVPTRGFQETYMEVAESPLSSAKSPEEINDYSHWPSPDWFDYRPIEAQCNQIRKEGRVVVFMGDRLNRIAQLKPAMYLRGVEKILLDMLLNPEIAETIFHRIRTFYQGYEERIFEAAAGKIDILLTGDDFGGQNAPLISPLLWSSFLKKGFTEYIRIAHAYGVRVMHHTCGSVSKIIPLLCDAGLDILQSLQPEAQDMDPHLLKKEFGKKLSFHGGISIQNTLPFGSSEEITKEVEGLIHALAPGGGYILCTSHNIQSDTPVENTHTLLRAYKTFGNY